MNLKQAFKIAAKSIAAKKGRSALTMLGIIIGLAAVIILVSYAQAQNQWMRDYYASLGTNTVQINANTWDGRDITERLYSYCQKMDSLAGVTPLTQFQATVKYSAKTLSPNNTDWEKMPQIYMGNQQFTLCQNFTVAKGRDLTYIDIEKENQVCILGSKAASSIFNYADPLGETIQLDGNPFKVVGVYEETDPTNMSGKDNTVLIPYTLSRLFPNIGRGGGGFVAKAKDADSVSVAVTALNGYLKGLVGNMGWYNVYSPNTWQQQSEDQNRMQSMFLGGIAAISLLVGGIGIVNIMLVTVTERTREIGIRKAIGAERKSIIAQFLIEACLICGIGGLIGIAVGYLATAVVTQLTMQKVMWPSVGITLGSFGFSVLMGIIFGIYPAAKASGLQPVEALRSD